MDPLDFQMIMLDRAFIQYRRAEEESKYWDMVEYLYECWNKDFKSYWGQFSVAYRTGSEFYSDDLPVDVFWKVLCCLTLAWYQNESLQVD